MEISANKLASYLRKVNQIKSFDSIFKETFDSSLVSAYYKKMGLVYRRYHSPDGAMHLPIKTTETERHTYKLLFQARSVEELIKKHNYKTIVELGCGTGFNSIYLAGIFPEVQFIAMDLTEANLEVGKANANGISNLTFTKFNFNEDAHTYNADLIFGIETLCYAYDLTKLFENMSACLHANGRIVIFDGYERTAAQYMPLTADEEKAYRLVCWGYALDRFQNLQQVYNAMQANNLIAELEKDYTKEVLPSYKTFQLASKKLVQFPLLTKTLLALKLIPYVLFMQVPSGIFGAYLMERNFLTYYQFNLKKKE